MHTRRSTRLLAASLMLGLFGGAAAAGAQDEGGGDSELGVGLYLGNCESLVAGAALFDLGDAEQETEDFANSDGNAAADGNEEPDLESDLENESGGDETNVEGAIGDDAAGSGDADEQVVVQDANFLVWVSADDAFGASLVELVNAPFAIAVRQGAQDDAESEGEGEDGDDFVACGTFGGAVAGDELVIPLRPLNDSGFSGVSVLAQEAEGEGVSSLYLFRDAAEDGLEGEDEPTPESGGEAGSAETTQDEGAAEDEASAEDEEAAEDEGTEAAEGDETAPSSEDGEANEAAESEETAEDADGTEAAEGEETPQSSEGDEEEETADEEETAQSEEAEATPGSEETEATRESEETEETRDTTETEESSDSEESEAPRESEETEATPDSEETEATSASEQTDEEDGTPASEQSAGATPDLIVAGSGSAQDGNDDEATSATAMGGSEAGSAEGTGVGGSGRDRAGGRVEGGRSPAATVTTMPSTGNGTGTSGDQGSSVGLAAIIAAGAAVAAVVRGWELRAE